MKKFRIKRLSQSPLLRHGFGWRMLLLQLLLSMSACASHPIPAPCPVLAPVQVKAGDPDPMQVPAYRQQWDQKVTTSVPSQTTSSTKPTPK